MNQTKRIERALTALVLDEPFFATLALKLALVESADVPTFCTDGRSLMFNPEYCATLKDNEIKTLLAHEVLHCALGHLWRKPLEADGATWNAAADHEANLTLEDSNELARHRGQVVPFPFPANDGHLAGPEFRNMAAESIYRQIYRKRTEQPSGGTGTGNDGNQHGDGGACQCFKPVADKAKAAQMRTEWERATIQAAKLARRRGSVPAQIARLVDELVNPRIDWRVVLREFLRDLATNDYNFFRANPRYVDTGFYLPVMRNETAGYVVFAIDTSGSVTPEQVAAFVSEAQSCLDELSPSRLTLIACDAAIQSNTTYTPGDTIAAKLHGGGGTDFRPVFDHLAHADAPDILVYLTDLQGAFPDVAPDYPVLWIVPECYADTRVPFGHVVAITE